MKKQLLCLALAISPFIAFSQDIKGNYCELVEVGILFKTQYVIYHDDKMDLLLDEKGEKVSTKISVTKALNIMADRGWELITVYVSKKGDATVNTYLFKRQKKD